MKIKRTYFIVIVFLIGQNSIFAQSKNKFSKEIGIDLIPLIKTIGRDDYQKTLYGFEFFLKSKTEKGALRLKLGRYNVPMSEEVMTTEIEVTSVCTDDLAYLTENQQTDHWVLNLGYAVRKDVDFFEISVGADLVLGRISSASNTWRRFCIDNNGVQSFENLAFHGYQEGKNLSFGIQPFIGVRKVFWERLSLGVECGIRFNRFFGEYPVFGKHDFFIEKNFSYWEIDFGLLTNDFSISYLF